MKLRSLLPVGAFCTLLACTACLQMRYVTFEQMVPPERYLPAEVQRLGVLNNFSENNIVIVNGALEITPCDGDTLMQCVAEAFADEGLFREVVVLDSCLYPVGDTLPHTLTQAEVQQLCRDLDVDMLFVCDFGCVAIEYHGEDVALTYKQYLVAETYVPNRTKPLHSHIISAVMPHNAIIEHRMERHLSPTARVLAQLAVQRYAPHWAPAERSFYSGFDRRLKDAALYVHEDNWEGALDLWRSYGTGRKPQQKLVALYNEALYHELHDSLDAALRCLDAAQALATDTTAVDSARVWEWLDYYGTDDYPYTDYQRIQGYRQKLQQRQTDIQNLHLISQ